MFRHAQLCLAARWAVTAGPVARTVLETYFATALVWLKRGT